MMYQVAVPSRSRPDLIVSCTLPVLTAARVPQGRITIWVLPDEQGRYQDTVLPLYPQVRVRPHDGDPAGGLRAARLAIQPQYPAGTRLVQADDDIRAIEYLSDGALHTVPDLDAIIDAGFRAADQNRVSLWGIYPARNAYFMRHRCYLGLRLVVGTFFGMTLRHDTAEQLDFDEKEDYERSIRHFLRDGAVLRADHLTVKTRFYTEPGGMQVYRDAAYQRSGTERLVARWPALLRLRESKGKGTAEVQFRRIQGHAAPPLISPEGLV